VNGVPLKRVNQAYVIATSTKVALPAQLPLDINDGYFAKEEAAKKEGEDKFFANTKTKTETSEKRKADQKTMDAAILPVIKKTDMLEAYMQAKFSLKKGDKPHEMKF
jgi:large subunit ribosomal protein L6e